SAMQQRTCDHIRNSASRMVRARGIIDRPMAAIAAIDRRPKGAGHIAHMDPVTQLTAILRHRNSLARRCGRKHMPDIIIRWRPLWRRRAEDRAEPQDRNMSVIPMRPRRRLLFQNKRADPLGAERLRFGGFWRGKWPKGLPILIRQIPSPGLDIR